ncbi:hypothetical protein ACCC84_21555 [Serratia odorifera]|uniref:hypothetical protein n=1 Tax=Serratia odorifera TaxID=618 RepID=UPI0035322CF1
MKNDVIISYKEMEGCTVELIESIRKNDGYPPSLTVLMKPFLNYFLLVYTLIGVGVFIDVYAHDAHDSIILVFPFFFMIFSAFVFVILVKFNGVFFMVPDDVMRTSKLILMLKSKLKKYAVTNSILWVLMALLTYFSGGSSIIIPVFVTFTMICSYAMFSLDMSRYQLSGLFGALQEAKNSMILSR